MQSTAYSLNGNILVLTHPADGSTEYTIKYLYFKIPTDTLEMYLTVACGTASETVGVEFSLDDEETYPPEEYEQLIVLLALKDYTTDRMSIVSGGMLSWRDEEKSMTKQGSSSFQSALDAIQRDINREYMKFSKPRVRSGGLVPRKASEYPGDY
jgi:hypothetical protein